MKLKRKALLLACALLCACQGPIVPSRSLRFIVVYEIDGQSITTWVRYKCYYEDVNWISARGPGWRIRSSDLPLNFVGKLKDGTIFEITPDGGSDYKPLNSNLCLANKSIDNDLIDVGTEWEVYSEIKIPSNHRAKITKSSIHLDAKGHSLFDPGDYPNPPKRRK